jgi:hypothetical protein
VVLIRGSFKHLGVGFTRLAKKLLKLLPLAPRLISQLLERSLGAIGFLLRLALLLLLLRPREEDVIDGYVDLRNPQSHQVLYPPYYVGAHRF